MIKAIFFDVDGTLYSHKSNTVPESTVKALEKLREKGILIFLATGRHFSEIDDFPVGKLIFDGYVMLTGQICTDGDRKMIHGNCITREAASYLFHAFEEKEIPVTLVEKDRMYVNFVNEAVVKAQKEVSTPVPPVGSYEGAPIYQIVCYGDRGFEKELALKVPECRLTRWCPYGVDIVSKEGGKMAGIQKMLEVYDLSREEIMAFGDGDNDIDMLQFAQIGVAMGNAEEEVKEAADYVTEDIDEDGIFHALQHFGLL